MANEYIRKEFNGASPSTTLNGAISDVATSIVVASGTGLPTGSTGRFVMVIDRNLATEEKVLVTTRAGTTLQSVQRGYDGTAAQAHSNGAIIEHCLDAYTLDQVNAMANAMSSQYDLVMRGATANAFTRIPIGADNTVLSVSSGVPGFAALGTNQLGNLSVTTAKLADSAVTSAKIADGTIATSDLADGSVTSAKIADGTITATDLATAVVNLLVPAGVAVAFLGTSAPTGWLLHNQAVANAQTLYPTLWTNSPASWKSGSTLNIPDLSDTVLAQTGGSAAALGAIGGAMTNSIATSNLPAHTHGAGTLAPSAHAVTDPQHGHSVSDPGHAHAPGGGYNNFVVQNLSGSNALDTLAGTGATIDNRTATASSTTGVSVSTNSTGITVGNHTMSGSTGDGGFAGTALTTRPRHLGVNIIIKAH